jgi:hypothetical protein
VKLILVRIEEVCVKDLPSWPTHGKPAQVRFGGVGAEDGLGAESLILTHVTFLLKTFLIFFEGGRVEATLRLPA